MKRVWRDKRLVAVISILLAIGAMAAAGIFLQIRKAKTILAEVKKEATNRQSIPIQIRGFSVAPNLNARLIRAPYVVRDVIAFQDKFFAATSNGLVVFAADGRQLEHWTPLEGFPSSDLTSLAVLNDSLWIGTLDSGFIGFSKGRWTHLLPKDTKHRTVHSLLVTSRGNLFAGTSDGIVAVEGMELRQFLPALRNETITSLAGNGHDLCIGTFQSGVYTYEAGVLNQYSKTQGLHDPYVTQVHRAPEGCYVSTASGVQVLQDKQFQTLAKNLFVTSFAIESSILWIATRDRGVIQLNTRRSAAPVAPTSALLRRSPTRIKKLDTLLLASSASDIFFLERGKEWRTWKTSTGLLTNVNVSALLRTRNGEMWIGYFDRGLDILSASGDSVTHFTDETLFCVNHISEDLAGRVYISTANGLVIFQPDGSRKIYRMEQGLLSDRVMQTLPLDPEGKVVAIATTQGFTLKEGESMKSIYAFHGLVNNHVYTMASDNQQIYLGTLGGISRVDKMQVTGNWTQMDSGLKRNWVNALLSIDKQLFIGTYGSGIQIRKENGEWLDFPALPSDLEINPNALYYNGTHLFCGTLDRGFYVFDTKTSTWKNVTRALPSLNVTAFAADADFLYVGTDRGLLQMKYDEIRTTPDIL